MTLAATQRKEPSQPYDCALTKGSPKENIWSRLSFLRDPESLDDVFKAGEPLVFASVRFSIAEVNMKPSRLAEPSISSACTSPLMDSYARC